MPLSHRPYVLLCHSIDLTIQAAKMIDQSSASAAASGDAEKRGFETSIDETPEYGPQALQNRQSDADDMQRLGKAQEFKRNFSYISTLGFTSVYMATWELTIIALTGGLYSGGFAGLFWAFLGTTILYAPVVLSIAEMESMAPTSGGQYHWVSEFAPPSCQKILSYASGWMSTLAWLAGQTSGIYLTMSLIQVVVNVKNPQYSFTNWQVTLALLGFILTLIVFNTWAAKALPMVQAAALWIHIFGFLAVIIPLLVLAPKNSAKDVFTVFVNESGYSSMGTAVLLNQVFSLYCILGSDTAVHISEEVADAGLVVARCIWWSYLLNSSLALGTVFTILFCFGPLDDAINADIPYLDLFLNMNNSAVAIFVLVLILILIYIGNITGLATVSRETWAFARDKGFPFSRWISKMDRRLSIPTNAVYLSSLACALLCLINLGSPLAFGIVVSVGLLALLSTYCISIGCILLKRIRGEPLPPARWSLGRYGIIINAWSFVYCCWAMVWCAMPTSLPVTVANANWGPALWAAVCLFATIVYIVHGRKHYTPPVSFVAGRKMEGVGIQSTM